MLKNMNDILERVIHYCRKHELLKSGDRILAAVSGGPDSVALLRIMCAIRDTIPLEIAAAHLEHGLRGESSIGDMEFVRKTANELGIVFHSKSASVADEKGSDESIEEAARRIRYQFLLDILHKTGYNRAATGHTLDDNVETIIYRLITGTGPSGITGILPQSGFVIHPLLGCTKEEILLFLDRNGYQYRVDETNSDTGIPRNKIRHRIIPQLSDINIKFKKHLVNLSIILREENDLMERITQDQIESLILQESDNSISIDYTKFFSIDRAIKRRIVHSLIKRLTGREFDRFLNERYLSFEVTENLAGKPVRGNKIIYRNKSVCIRKEYGCLIFQKRVVDDVKNMYLYSINGIGQKIILEEIGREVEFSVREAVSRFEENKLYLDLENVEFPFLIRNRREGDRIRLKNLGLKKIKTIFINDKVPPGRRDEVPVVVINGEIAGIFSTYYGKQNRVAESYMISESTRKVLVCDLSRPG
jgi:tRNA(Ile)-lysidine synthase